MDWDFGEEVGMVGMVGARWMDLVGQAVVGFKG